MVIQRQHRLLVVLEGTRDRFGFHNDQIDLSPLQLVESLGLIASSPGKRKLRAQCFSVLLNILSGDRTVR